MFSTMLKYYENFTRPYFTSLKYFNRVESERILERSLQENVKSYAELYNFNLKLGAKAINGSFKSWSQANNIFMKDYWKAYFNTITNNRKGENLFDFMARQAKTVKMMKEDLPNAINDIGNEFGVQVDNGKYVKVAETDRFYLYQALPLKNDIEVDDSLKPILIIPPYVLGINILAFLPNQGKSYIHNFANKGIPTYIRVVKDIDTNPSVQIMTGEDDCLDTVLFCEILRKKHNQKVTLNGYCQGGFISVASMVTGKLNNSVDNLITCVAPMDGTRSENLMAFMNGLPKQFNDLEYGTKILPSGNRVADGDLMGWVYKIKSIEQDFPIAAIWRDWIMCDSLSRANKPIPKTVAGINHWLVNDRTDIPLAITKLSYDSHNIPVKDDGTLPVKLFDKKLNFKALKDVSWLICYGEKDDLVEKDAALAPLDHIQPKVTMFPKGHVAIATSWTAASSYQLHTSWFDKAGNEQVGPVKFHLDSSK